MVGFPIINRQTFGAAAPLGTIYSFQMVGAGMALDGWLVHVPFPLGWIPFIPFHVWYLSSTGRAAHSILEPYAS